MTRGPTRKLSIALRVIAALFILAGISSAIRMIVAFSQDETYVDPGVLGIFIGAGLLRLRPAWRVWAVVFTWIEVISFPINASRRTLRIGTPPATLAS